MTTQVFGFLASAVSACVSWFTELFEKGGLISFWFPAVVIVLLVTHLIKPLLSSGSDFARKSSKSSSDDPED